jgi:hypothetical protein
MLAFMERIVASGPPKAGKNLSTVPFSTGFGSPKSHSRSRRAQIPYTLFRKSREKEEKRMADVERRAHVVWEGDLAGGNGRLTEEISRVIQETPVT